MLRAGDARAALEQLKQEVRKAPRDARLRIFLFQLFCVFGEWQRAVTQLAAAAQMDPEAAQMAQAYRAALRCELVRAKVFAGTQTPTILGEPSPWMSLLVEALRLLAAGQTEAAAGLRDAAFEQAPASRGNIDGTAFEWIADADPRLGPVLEVMIDGKYCWAPFARLRAVQIEPPADLRDKVWLPAHFDWAGGGDLLGFVPTRYPGSHAAEDVALALAARTDWREHGPIAIGLGQRMLATDAGEFALMDVRRIALAEAA